MASTEFSTRSRKSAGFLFFLGFALVATGIAFALAPHYSWQVTQVARQASALGLENGLLLLSGALFFGLGIVARSASTPATVHDPRPELESMQSEVTLLNEQFSTKLAQIRTSLLQVREGLATLSAQQEAQAQERAQSPGTHDQSHEALFRLAASLDKLHAHLDERVHAVDLQMRSGFETLLGASQEMRRLLDQGMGQPAPGALPAPVEQPVEFGLDTQLALDSQLGLDNQLGLDSQPAETQAAPAEEGGIDFYKTMEKLDAIADDAAAEVDPPLPSPEQLEQDVGRSLDELLPEEYRDTY